jgi:hypothetical protein
MLHADAFAQPYRVVAQHRADHRRAGDDFMA